MDPIIIMVKVPGDPTALHGHRWDQGWSPILYTNKKGNGFSEENTMECEEMLEFC